MNKYKLVFEDMKGDKIASGSTTANSAFEALDNAASIYKTVNLSLVKRVTGTKKPDRVFAIATKVGSKEHWAKRFIKYDN